MDMRAGPADAELVDPDVDGFQLIAKQRGEWHVSLPHFQ
jgi:hypothetical protein